MKEILSSQYHRISGGWQDRDGSGKRSSSNGGSGAANSGGNSGNRSGQSYLSKNSPYGSGSAANGIWGENTMKTGNGYGGNGTGAGMTSGRRELGGKNH
ncbi:hypothetical protein [Dryocola sp. BD613]|uniref:hypothetical protein n=1 Tax=Dryocola sp. BD613 TaxID=3133272 RepID=UPI003F507AA9